MGVPGSWVSRITGITVTPKNFNVGKAQMLPQQLVIIGQGNDDVLYSLEKYECEGSSAAVGERFGYGSPLHLAARQLFPSSGAMATFPVYICPVKKGDTGFAAASGSVLVTGTAATANASCVLCIGGIDVQLAVTKGQTPEQVMADIVTAVNAITERPVTAESDENLGVKLTSRWSGALGNRISLSWSGDIPGLTAALTAFDGGAGVPAIDDALSAIGSNLWATFILNTFDYKNADGSESSLLDTYFNFADGRWSWLEKKPCYVAHGCTDSYAVRTAITDNRKSDYANFLCVSVGSPELPFVVAAKWLMDILTTADSNPPQGYTGNLTGLKRGADSAQENETVRNQSVKKGSSTNITDGSVAAINDVVSFYHPDGEGNFPARRYIVDGVKLMNIVYNLRLITEAPDVKASPLLPEDQPTSNPTAKTTKDFKTWFANLAVSLGDNAIISDVDFTIKNMTVKIDSANSKRVNYKFPTKVSGNIEIVDGEVLFGQYVGA